MAGQNLDDRFKSITKDVERLNLLMAAVIIVLFIGFAAMFGTMATLVISHFDNSKATLQSLNNQIVTQNTEIKQLLNNPR